MTGKPKLRIPDPETRKRLRENLLAASAGLRAWSEETQVDTDETASTTRARLVSCTRVKEL